MSHKCTWAFSPSLRRSASLAVSLACSLCMQQQWQPTGADIFLKQPPGCCVWRSAACLPPGIQGQGDCTSAIWTHNFARLRVSFAAAASHSCYLFHRRRFLLPMKPKNFNEEQPRSVSAYPYRCKSPLKFPPSSVCTCHLHFNGNAF